MRLIRFDEILYYFWPLTFATNKIQPDFDAKKKSNEEESREEEKKNHGQAKIIF